MISDRLSSSLDLQERPTSAPATLTSMSVLSSQVERESDVFAQRRERMEALVAKLRERSAEVARGGGDKAIERHRSRGKLTARERVDRLLDPERVERSFQMALRRRRDRHKPHGSHPTTAPASRRGRGCCDRDPR